MNSLGKALIRRPLWLGLALVLPVSALAIAEGFDGLYGQDPYAYYAYAVGPLGQSLRAGQLWPLPPFFWPPGYPLLMSALSLVAGPTALTGQLVSLFAGGLIPIFTAFLARELLFSAHEPVDLKDESYSWLPIVAGLFAALTPQLWQSSAVVMADTVGLAMATLGAGAVVRYGRRRRGRWLVVASGAFAWAILTRWIYALVAIPSVVVALASLGRQFSAARSRAIVHGLAAGLVALIILSPLLVTQLARKSSAFVGDLEVYDWSPLTAFQREHDTVDGHLSYPLPNGLYYAIAPAHRAYFTPLLAIFILPGGWWVVQRRTLARICLLIGWPLVVYGFHAGAPWQNFRFTLAYLPPLAILAALGIGWAWQKIPAHWRWAIGVWVGIGLLGLAASGAQLTYSFIARKSSDLALVRTVEARLPAGARLLTFMLTLTFQHYSTLETIELSELKPAALPDLLADFVPSGGGQNRGRPTFLLLDVHQIETQWRGLPLEASYHWLRDKRGLTTLGQFDSYTLFEVNPP